MSREIKVPYENATSGHAARGDISDMLQRFGCDKVGFMEDYAKSELILQFVYRGRQIQLKASAKGWAAMYLRARPWSNRKTLDERAYEHKAYLQGLIAVNSILRDWVKSSLTAIESGLMQFETAFMPFTLLEDGRSVMQAIEDAGILQLEQKDE